MQPLDFREIAELINLSRTTAIDPEPVKRQEHGWALYQGEYRVHTSRLPLQVLYLHSRATRDAIEAARREAFTSGKTQVVYPPSLDQSQTSHRELLEKSAAGFWTTKDYLSSFINDELQAYLAKLPSAPPSFYVDPIVEVPAALRRKVPNPLRSFLVDPEPLASSAAASLAVLLAEPGQGKTYMCDYLTFQLKGSRQQLVPLFINSEQWESLPVAELASLAKTITHCFRYFEAPIGWLEGHEEQFLQTTLKAGLFRIIFDGFDEYILRNRGSIQPGEALDALANLATETGARILITSRTSFWNTNVPEPDREQFTTRAAAKLYRILPFDQEHARNYFRSRLEDDRRIATALHIYGSLRRHNEELVGRGFVLNLIADLVGRLDGADIHPAEGANALLWLMDALCQRETKRHQLPYTASVQLAFLRAFAVEVASGESPSSVLLEVCMEDAQPDLPRGEVSAALEKLSIHPLIEPVGGQETWRFKHEQIEIALLAEHVVEAEAASVRAFTSTAKLLAGTRHDLAEKVIDLLQSADASSDMASRVRALLAMMAPDRRQLREPPHPSSEGSKLLTDITLAAVESLAPRGRPRDDRTKTFLSLVDGPPATGLEFGGAIGSFDWRGCTFVACRFDQVTWANCIFDESTVFERCHFAGGAAPEHCQGFGSVQLKNCSTDALAKGWINAAQVSEGKRAYTNDDLQADLHSVLSKFIVRGGHGFRSLKQSGLARGPISASRHKDDILEGLFGFVLEHHTISGQSEAGINIRPAAEDAVRFFAVNNVFTGPLAEALLWIQKKIGLRP